jgi:gas vesicle protein
MWRFLIGIGTGYLVGLLIAPAAGAETRKRLQQQADAAAREKARKVGAQAAEAAYDAVKERVAGS